MKKELTQPPKGDGGAIKPTKKREIVEAYDGRTIPFNELEKPAAAPDPLADLEKENNGKA